ncbi:hypothetical protein RB195_025720 [Necator americanus]|uniref:7TM GPCR serpentine receptor class x (Srx) domain-containing protein n=1 Tax=Necator americanus TaxID=51031 RepID=A0ABR1ETR6_NECAM
MKNLANELRPQYLQVTIPLLIVIIPGCSVMSVVWMGDFRSVGSFVLVIQNGINVALFMIGTHGFIGTIIMIIVNEPYRRFVVDTLKKSQCMCHIRKVEPSRRLSMDPIHHQSRRQTLPIEA